MVSLSSPLLLLAMQDQAGLACLSTAEPFNTEVVKQREQGQNWLNTIVLKMQSIMSIAR